MAGQHGAAKDQEPATGHGRGAICASNFLFLHKPQDRPTDETVGVLAEWEKEWQLVHFRNFAEASRARVTRAKTWPEGSKRDKRCTCRLQLLPEQEQEQEEER
ncbi:hypothetical protein AWZ03_007622 [Drosophila navojoa]|uniref:Uncharacterized protein n=1 Tax=Drosophila navojoa TaxID=7232 RepID=A0A484BC62_DRONA|nr:hypothetical protein AWZ03_007622 [Drosophila navojoa]